MNAANTYTGETHLIGGKLILEGSLASTSITIDDDTIFEDNNSGLISGATLTNNGTTTLGSNEAITTLNGNGMLNLQEGSLTVNNGTYSGVITGSDTSYGLTKATSGTLTLSGNNTYVGTTQVDAGTLTLTGSLLSRMLNIASGATLNDVNGGLASDCVSTINGSLVLSCNDTFDTLDGSGIVNLNASTLTVNQGSFSGIISGSGGLTKSSEDTLILSGDNTYTGTTQINDGTLTLSGSLDSSAINISSNATLTDSNGGLSSSSIVANAGTLSLGADDTIGSLINSGIINGTGKTLTASTYALNDGSEINVNLGSGTATTTGTVTLHGTCAASVVNINAGSTLNLMEEQLLSENATVNLNGLLVLNGGDQTVNILNGTGNVEANSYQFYVTGGGDFTGQINATGTQLNVQGGSLNLTDSVIDTDLINIDNGSTTNLSGSGSVAVTNSITIAQNSVLNVGDNSSLTNTGDVTMQPNSSLNVTSGASFTAQGNIMVDDNATIHVDTDGALTATNIVTGENSTITVPDSSKLTYTTLSGNGTIDTQGNAFTNSGTVTGFVTFSGDFVNSGNVRPGNSPGLITIAGNYTDGAELDIQIETTTPITGHDQVRVGGTVTLLPTSILNVQAYNGVMPARGNVYQIIADSSGGTKQINGTFGSVVFDDDASGSDNAVANAAVLFDLATGQLIATGLNDKSSKYKDYGSNRNERRVALALFGEAQVGPSQIDTTTVEGTLAKQIVVAEQSPGKSLSYYVPNCYAAMADYAFSGDRAFVREISNRISTFNAVSDRTSSGWECFTGYLNSHIKNADKAHIKRRDYLLGFNMMSASGFLIGAAASRNTGHMHCCTTKGDMDGTSGIIYVRKPFKKKFIALGTVGYSSIDNDLHRITFNGKAKGDTRSHAWTGSLGLQYLGWTLGKFSLTPRCTLIYSYAKVNGFKEKGPIDALHNDGFNSKLFTGEAALSALYRTKILNRPFGIEAILGIEKAFGRSKSEMDVSVVKNRSIDYSIKFCNKYPTRVNYGVNVGYDIWKRSTLYFGYEGFTGSRDDHFFNVGLNWKF